MWRVVAAAFVTLDAGTGIVHIAPAFGEDDYEAHRQPGARSPGPSALLRRRAGRHVHRTLRALRRSLGEGLRQRDPARSQGRRTYSSTRRSYRHEYPFCWRADDDPLIQYARPAWYIRTTAVDRPRDREQPRGPLAARAHQRRSLRRLPREQRRLGALARALLGHAAQRLGVRRERGPQGGAAQHRSNREPKPARLRSFSRGATSRSYAQRAPHRPQAVDRRGHVPLPCCVRWNDAPRPRGHRLLVRLGLHAVRAVGLSAPGARGRSSRAFPPTSSARRSIRRAAGSTRC